jgi:hypothetical protein
VEFSSHCVTYLRSKRKKISNYSSFKKPTCGPVSSVQGNDELRYGEIVLGPSSVTRWSCINSMHDENVRVSCGVF